MHGSIRNPLLAAAMSLAATLGAPSVLHAEAPAAAPAPGVESNFGLPLGFSVAKMDRSADPRQDFDRYAAGRWLDVATIPGDKPLISGIVVLGRNVERQVGDLLTDAAARSPAAVPGTPLQQVGDFYASGMDETRLAELKATPLKSEWERIAVIDSQRALAETLAHLALILNDPVLCAATVAPDPQDTTKYAIYVGDGQLPMPALEDYLSPDMAKTRAAYLTLLTQLHVLAGLSDADAQARAAQLLAMETRIAGKQLTPVERRDPSKRLTRMSYADLKKLLSNFDVDAYFQALGLPTGGEVVAVDVGALTQRNAMLGAYSLDDTKRYLQWELLRHVSPYLAPEFATRSSEFIGALYGLTQTPKRDKLVASEVAERLGHPLGQLYVEKYLPPQSKTAAEELVGHIREEFRARLEQNPWLSAATRNYALQKLDKIKIIVGYPETWIDLSGVPIRRDDYYGNMLRLNEFRSRRDLAKLGKPVVEDSFNDPEATLPTVVNAAYSPDHNGIEIPAAFLQPPFYDAQADAAVNYCTLGAVIGHEITHGFDSMGRLYDADGNARNWWSEADGKAFVARAQTLVDQASAYEVLPGVKVNGQLSVGENLADVGGMMLGYNALQAYLKAHPQENHPIDGYTPSQRCFIAWAQIWADKQTPEMLQQTALSDPHPPGMYRMLAPLQHLPGFFEAFGIRAGDPMWRDPNESVAIW